MKKIITIFICLCFLLSFFVFSKQKVYSATPTPTPVSACSSLPCNPLPMGCKSGDFGFENTPKGKCFDCVNGVTLQGGGISKIPGVWTALGCVNTKPEDFVAQLLGWVIGIGGGIAFLLIVFGGFQIVTSSGDPEKLNSGKEIIVSAITGLLMIVFSVILLHLIGVDILKIPGFGV